MRRIALLILLLSIGGYAWLEGWNYRIRIPLKYEGAEDVYDIVANVTIPIANLVSDGYMYENCSDVRVTTNNDTFLPYVIEECSDVLRIRFKIPYFPANSTQTFYIYIGNKNATVDLSDPTKVYLVYEDFDTDVFSNPPYYGTWGKISGNPHVANGWLVNPLGADSYIELNEPVTLTENQGLRMYARFYSTGRGGSNYMSPSLKYLNIEDEGLGGWVWLPDGIHGWGVFGCPWTGKDIRVPAGYTYYTKVIHENFLRLKRLYRGFSDTEPELIHECYAQNIPSPNTVVKIGVWGPWDLEFKLDYLYIEKIVNPPLKLMSLPPGSPGTPENPEEKPVPPQPSQLDTRMLALTLLAFGAIVMLTREES